MRASFELPAASSLAESLRGHVSVQKQPEDERGKDGGLAGKTKSAPHELATESLKPCQLLHTEVPK